MLTKDDLASIQNPPNFKDFTLATIAEFFQEYLCNNSFEYTLEDSNQILIHFSPNDLAHLLGIHKISTETGKIKGNKAFSDIVNGKVTISQLQGLDPNRFGNINNRIRYFPFIYQLLQNPTVIEFDKTKIKNCNIDCNFIMYDDYTKKKIHFGVSKHPSNESFFPKTFFVEKGNKYTTSQTLCNIDKISIISKLKPQVTKDPGIAAATKSDSFNVDTENIPNNNNTIDQDSP